MFAPLESRSSELECRLVDMDASRRRVYDIKDEDEEMLYALNGIIKGEEGGMAIDGGRRSNDDDGTASEAAAAASVWAATTTMITSRGDGIRDRSTAAYVAMMMMIVIIAIMMMILIIIIIIAIAIIVITVAVAVIPRGQNR
jgi:hypothetical protein